MRKRMAAALAMMLALTACGIPQTSQEEETGYLLYYLAENEDARGGDMIRGSYEELPVAEDASAEAKAKAVVYRLLEGSTDGSLRSPFPEDVRLLSLNIQDRRATVDLSSGFSQLSGVELAMAD